MDEKLDSQQVLRRSSDVSTNPPSTPPRVQQRAIQPRAEITRAKILRAAIELFSSQGYDGASIRLIETAAGVKRGLVNHHYGTKAELWKAAVTEMFDEFSLLPARQEAESTETDLRNGIQAFVRFSAAHPELNRLMVQEGKAPSWRLDYLVEHFVRPRVEWMSAMSGQPLDPHALYMLIGAATFVFDVEYECRALFGVDPRSRAFVDAHADAVTDLLLGRLRIGGG